MWFTIDRDGASEEGQEPERDACSTSTRCVAVATRRCSPLRVPDPSITVNLNFRHQMNRILFRRSGRVLIGSARGATQQPEPSAPPPQQPSDVRTTITGGDAGAPPRFAVPDFVALSNDAETIDAARTIARVLFDDLTFEREFALIPRDTYATIPPATSTFDVPFDRWRELNADGVIIGAVEKTAGGVRVEVRLFNVRSRQQVFAKEYTGSVANRRLYAHTVSDDIHQQQRALRGVARTKLTFNSDRSGERMSGTVENRTVKEVYISDYDGESQRQVTTNRSLNINSVWSNDGRSIAYTSYRRGPPTIFIANIYEGTSLELTKGNEQSWTPAWSPDGARIAFSSTRDGNPEIYVANRDGSNVRRLTNHQANDITPTWSPSGTQIAFTSNRRGEPQIWGHGRRRWPDATDLGIVRRSTDLVAGARQRDRVCGTHGSRPGHPDHRRGHAAGPAGDVR